MVAAPGVVGWEMVKTDVVPVHIQAFEPAAGIGFHFRTGHIDVDQFVKAEAGNKLGVGGVSSFQFSGPGFLFVNPAEPGRGVLGPFGRKVITLLTWG